MSLFLSLIFSLSSQVNAGNGDFYYLDENASYIHSLASLNYHVHSLEKRLSSESNEPQDEIEHISFSEEKIHSFWVNSVQFLDSIERDSSVLRDQKLLQLAYRKYEEAHQNIVDNEIDTALNQLTKSAAFLNYLWKKAVDSESSFFTEDGFQPELLLRAKGDSNLEHNRYIKTSIRRKIRPYVIPSNHPMKPVLDELFSTRVTQDKWTLKKAGFKIVDRRSRSFICVVSHPSLPDYLLKLHYDSDDRKKQDRSSWEWLVKRCQGAEKIQSIIRKYRIKNFVCAKKWIYCLPEEPSPIKKKHYTRHLAVLLVTDMHLIPSSENLRAWYYNITEEHLNELYIMVTRGKGSSYRPDNMPFTKEGKIAFIDTEYPNKGPDFNSIRRYLNPEMRRLWDRIVNSGGP